MTILNQVEIYETKLPTWFFVGFFVLLIGLLLLIAITNKSESYGSFLAFIGVGVLIILWTFALRPLVAKEVPTGRCRYECTIDDDASFTDICEKYTVVEQRGDLWVLEDKG